jgi:hypothetical protein
MTHEDHEGHERFLRIFVIIVAFVVSDGTLWPSTERFASATST